MNWLPIAEYSEEKYDLKWLLFSDGQSAACRFIYVPTFMDFGLAFQPTHFAVIEMPNQVKAIEPPTLEATAKKVRAIVAEPSSRNISPQLLSKPVTI